MIKSYEQNIHKIRNTSKLTLQIKGNSFNLSDYRNFKRLLDLGVGKAL